MAFIRLTTRVRCFRCRTPDEALATVEAWIGAAPSVIVNPTARHPDIVRSLIVETGTAGNLTTDAHLAAIGVEHGARLVSFDRDFERFSGVPLQLLT